MEAISASATIHKKTLYITAVLEDTHGKTSGRFLVYSTNEHKWSTLPVPQIYSAITVVNHHITLIGGQDVLSGKVNKALFTWYEEGQWKQVLPPMPTGRCIPAVISHDNLLLVTGGVAEDFSTVLNSTDVLDLTTMKWTTPEALKLPVPLWWHFLILCGDYIYLVGGVKTYPLESLDGYNSKAWRTKWSDVKQAAASQHSQPRMSVWTQIADHPNLAPTAVSCAGTLYTVGGYIYTEGDEMLRGVYAYDTTRNQWVSVGDMSVGRSLHCAVPLSNASIFVAGGQVSNEGKISLSSSAELLLL